MWDPVIVSFVVFLLLFVAVGAWSARRRSATTDDYLLASRSIGPWFTALSAVATNNSGFMFIGLVGATYTVGVSGVWIMAGWILGDYLMWFWIHRRLREESEAHKVNTIPSFLAWGTGRHAVWIKSLGGGITLVFLGTYAAAQLNAGSKALHVLFGWDYAVGAVIGAGIVLVYSFAGGIRASIWTDVAQSIVMLGAMLLLWFVAVEEIGGAGALWARLEAIDPQLVNPIPQDLKLGFTLHLLGWLGAGVGVIGQPHIMIRAMAIRNSRELRTAQHIYFAWYVVFTAAAIGVALACRVLLPEVGDFDAELALPALSLELLPAALVGLVLAGLFAATMSTADSQVLSCSAALTQDLNPRWRDSYAKAKTGTAAVTAVVLAIALLADQNVFSLVAMSWSVLGATLGPVMFFRVRERRVSAPVAAASMTAGLAAVIAWRSAGLGNDVFEILPGLLAGTLTYALLLRIKGWRHH